MSPNEYNVFAPKPFKILSYKSTMIILTIAKDIKCNIETNTLLSKLQQIKYIIYDGTNIQNAFLFINDFIIIYSLTKGTIASHFFFPNLSNNIMSAITDKIIYTMIIVKNIK